MANTRVCFWLGTNESVFEVCYVVSMVELQGVHYMWIVVEEKRCDRESGMAGCGMESVDDAGVLEWMLVQKQMVKVRVQVILFYLQCHQEVQYLKVEHRK